MRLILLPLCACATIAAIAPEAPESMMPGYTRPAQQWSSVEQAIADKQCADRIEQVRDATGEPKLDRTPASSEKPMLIAAVDKRIDGCAVLQMKGDVNDLRPVPEHDQGQTKLEPAH